MATGRDSPDLPERTACRYHQDMRTIIWRVVALGLGATVVASGCGATGGSEQPLTVAPSEGNTTTTLPLELPAVNVRLEEAAKVDRPTALAYRNGSDDVFVAEQSGKVRRILAEPDGTYELDERPLLDISNEISDEGERGLLGLAFSPDGRQLYLHFTDSNGDTQVVRYNVTNRGVDTASRETVFTTPQPFANHNGGQLAFGPDGYLYIGLGDGGGAGDPERNAQNLTSPLGKVLRIDPDGALGDEAYAIPVDNPFADGVEGAPEIWLSGLRNPWRFSFDRSTGDLWVADVGQQNIEEITLLRAGDPTVPGANLGWPFLEGTRAFGDEPAPDGLVAPVFEYTHDPGCSVIGGFVYRGRAIEGLAGTYVFGDWCDPALRMLQVSDDGRVGDAPLGPRVNKLTGFGEDNRGELWALSADGGVFRILPA